MNKIEKYYIDSCGRKIYVEIGYPEGKIVKRNAVVVAHGLRSYYTGFLDTFAKRLRDVGYISVKFHFLGTGKSDGNFEEKTTKFMLQNYNDVIDFLKKHPNVKNIGVVGRSNAGTLAALAGPDDRVKSYVLLAAAVFLSKSFELFVNNAKREGGFFYHPSYKRPHTKGEGRLPLSFLDEIRGYDKQVLDNIPKLKNVAFFQSTEDEAVTIAQGHFDYYKKYLSKPNKLYLIEGGNHSYKGHKKFVIDESIKWFKKTLK